MKLCIALSLAIFSAVASATSPLPRIPSGWQAVGDTPRGTKIELVFAVKQQNLKLLEETVLAVSDPRSSLYGKHLSNEDVHAMVAPATESVQAVNAFLAAHGVSGASKTPNSDFIVAQVSVEKAEAMLAPKGIHFTEFRHPEGHIVHRLRVADADLTLPRNVRTSIDMVAPTNYVPTVRTLHRDIEAAEAPNALFNTPKVLRSLYNVGSTQGKGGKYKQAVTAFLDQTYSESSLQTFYKLFCGANQTFTCGQNSDATKVGLVGDETKGAGGTESMLDIEYIGATGAGVATEFWGFSGRNPYQKNDEPFLKWLYTVGNTSDADVPKLFSTSYGEDEDLIPQAWSERTNVEFQKAGARGISLLFASGDSGAAGDSGCGGKGNDLFVPQWPSGSPWVTAVGGTSGSSPEVVAGLSSGGFSNRWDRPSWQKNAVSAYLTSAKLPDKKHFNSTGRGFPDIAAQAVNFVVVQFGIPLPGVSGTSCASPTAAGVFGLLNDLRASANKSPLGFLNPFIYQNAASFNDITSGSNNGCGFSTPGYPAAKGWDAATGLGSPDYSKLSAAVKALP